MNYWFLADTHFHHKNILKDRSEFSSIEEMNEKLVENYNKIVKPNDIVFHLGDVSFKINEVEPIIKRLNGQINLIIGNHDYENENKYKNMNKFNWVKSYHKFKINNNKIILFHFPIASWDCIHHGSYHFHGHSHAQYQGKGLSLDVGVDMARKILGEYRPFNYDEIISYLTKPI